MTIDSNRLWVTFKERLAEMNVYKMLSYSCARLNVYMRTSLAYGCKTVKVRHPCFRFFLLDSEVVSDNLFVAFTKADMSSSEVEMKAGHPPAGCYFAAIFGVLLRTLYYQLRLCHVYATCRPHMSLILSPPFLNCRFIFHAVTPFFRLHLHALRVSF